MEILWSSNRLRRKNANKAFSCLSWAMRGRWLRAAAGNLEALRLILVTVIRRRVIRVHHFDMNKEKRKALRIQSLTLSLSAEIICIGSMEELPLVSALMACGCFLMLGDWLQSAIHSRAIDSMEQLIETQDVHIKFLYDLNSRILSAEK